MKPNLVFSPSGVQEGDGGRFKTAFKLIQVISAHLIPSHCVHLTISVIIFGEHLINHLF